jgi:hypothetical protein
LAKEKEELNKDRNNFVVDLTAAERDNRKQAEVKINKSFKFFKKFLLKLNFLVNCCLKSR